MKFKKKKTVTQPDPAKVEMVDVKDIKLWADNPRKNDKAYKDLAVLLKEHGQKTPIVVWKKNRTIYKGNTTFKAAKHLKWEKIWVIWADFKDESDAVAYGLADNKSSEWSDWDDNILAELIPQNFQGDVKNLARITGFKEADLNSFFAAESNELPDELAEVDIQGLSADGKADYLVLQFPSNKDMLEFRDRVGQEGKQPRVINVEALMKAMEWKEKGKETIVKKKKFKKLRRR